MPTRTSSGKQPWIGAHGDRSISAALLYEIGEQAVDGAGHSERDGAEGELDRVVGDGDVGNLERDQPGGGLTVEQHQQPGDPIARLQVGVFDQVLDQAPSFVVAGQGVSGAAGLRYRCRDVVGVATLYRPCQELVDLAASGVAHQPVVDELLPA